MSSSLSFSFSVKYWHCGIISMFIKFTIKIKVLSVKQTHGYYMDLCPCILSFHASSIDRAKNCVLFALPRMLCVTLTKSPSLSLGFLSNTYNLIYYTFYHNLSDYMIKRNRVTNCPGFSTENPLSWDNSQSWTKQGIWLPEEKLI